MALWNDFLLGRLPYQHYWLPLAIGVAAGVLCLTMGNVVARWRRPARREGAGTSDDASVQTGRLAHDPFVQGSYTENRKSLRRRGNLVEVLYSRPDNRNVVERALVLDRSLGGLRLAVGERLAPETRLVVLPVNSSDQVPWVEIEVRTCSQVKDSWELGCQFVKTPQWSILLMFG